MKVFYWTEGMPMVPPKLMQADSVPGYAAEIPGSQTGPDVVFAMLEAGFTEISWRTAYVLGLPT